MFGNLNATGRHHESHGGRDIKTLGATTTGATSIEDGFPISIDLLAVHVKHFADPNRGSMGPHNARRAGDLLDRFTLHTQSNNKGADLSRSRFTSHDLFHDFDHHRLG